VFLVLNVVRQSGSQLKIEKLIFSFCFPLFVSNRVSARWSYVLPGLSLALMKAGVFFWLDPPCLPWLPSRLIAAAVNFLAIECHTYSYRGKYNMCIHSETIVSEGHYWVSAFY